MADITMCTGEKCKLKKSCYRFTAPVNVYWQSYFLTPPIKEVEGKKICDLYWKVGRGSDEDKAPQSRH